MSERQVLHLSIFSSFFITGRDVFGVYEVVASDYDIITTPFEGR